MATRRPAECAICYTNNSLIIRCLSEQHIFCHECVVNCFQSRTTAESTVAGQPTGLSCPLSRHCGSQIEFTILKDVLSQTKRVPVTEKLNDLAVDDAVWRDSRIQCPRCPYFFIAEFEETDFEQLFIPCPRCRKDYCLTCKLPLSSQGYSDHICPPEKSVSDTDANLQLHEVLTEAIAVRCPNNQCRASNRGRVLAVKEPGDCNAMRCGTCGKFFCLICSKQLGRESQEAHQAFPHRNAKMPMVQECWLFDDDEQGCTEERAKEIRQLIAVKSYLDSLQMSANRKATLLRRNRPVLGELFYCLQLTGAVTVTTKKVDKCVLM